MLQPDFPRPSALVRRVTSKQLILATLPPPFLQLTFPSKNDPGASSSSSRGHMGLSLFLRVFSPRGGARTPKRSVDAQGERDGVELSSTRNPMEGKGGSAGDGGAEKGLALTERTRVAAAV
jgi:hypothetical protein